MRIRTTVQLTFTTPDITTSRDSDQYLLQMQRLQAQEISGFLQPLLVGARDVRLAVACTREDET